jgi:hypothetical protein
MIDALNLAINEASCLDCESVMFAKCVFSILSDNLAIIYTTKGYYKISCVSADVRTDVSASALITDSLLGCDVNV